MESIENTKYTHTTDMTQVPRILKFENDKRTMYIDINSN